AGRPRRHHRRGGPGQYPGHQALQGTAGLTMTVLTLSAGRTTARITTNGGAVLRLDHAGVPLLRPAEDDALPIDSACYPLVPFGNRICGNRFAFEGKEYALEPNTDWDRHYLHGEGWRSQWSIS